MRKHDIFLLLFIALVIAFLPTESIGAAKRDSSNAPFATTQITSGGAGGVPVGTIIAWPVASDPEDPENWLECNGQAIDRTVYPELWAVVGANIPDLRGLFLRGYGGKSAELGIQQGDAVGEHKHNFQIPVCGSPDWPDERISMGPTDWGDSRRTFSTLETGNGMSEETRPVNMSVRYLIRAIL